MQASIKTEEDGTVNGDWTQRQLRLCSPVWSSRRDSTKGLHPSP
jgi:hypothetical protein